MSAGDRNQNGSKKKGGILVRKRSAQLHIRCRKAKNSANSLTQTCYVSIWNLLSLKCDPNAAILASQLPDDYSPYAVRAYNFGCRETARGDRFSTAGGPPHPALVSSS